MDVVRSYLFPPFASTLDSLLNYDLPSNKHVTSSLTVLGALTFARYLYRLFSFAHLHFLRRSTLHRYASPHADGRQAWAIVSGSSDGLGRAFAEELLTNGLNVIIHGRNKAKLERVRAELLKAYPARQVEMLLLDATTSVDDPALFAAVTERFKNHHITMLINNVGGPTLFKPMCAVYEQRARPHDRLTLNVNVIFHLELTRAVLPTMKSHNQPSAILTIGNSHSQLPGPYVSVLAASKAFLESWSRSLAAEMNAEGCGRISVRYERLVMCRSRDQPSDRAPVSWKVPSAKTYVKSSLRTVEGGQRVIWGYWPHAVQLFVMLAMPLWVRERLLLGTMRGFMKKEQKQQARLEGEASN
jgi:17beta-estradiol 17-dehydrogenase / very-long-chain 3-oxoacyl-CoA reductase